MSEGFYLKQLIDKNIGPLTDVHIDFPFDDNGNPKPIVLVGENGTGKSTILSNIVDAFFEMAGKAFDNANQPNDREGHQYFKTISPAEVHIGSSYMLSYISFAPEKNTKYIFKAGNLSTETFHEFIDDSSFGVSWGDTESKKIVLANEDTVAEAWKNNVICYFGPDRYEKPVWMGDKYYRNEEFLHPTSENNWARVLKNPIIVQDVTFANLPWIMDVIADSRVDFARFLDQSVPDDDYLQDLHLLYQARHNLETILSKIMGVDVYFQLNFRNRGGSRFGIIKDSDDTVLCPTLDSLSTGQSALFNMFATIVRYADNNDINQSYQLNDITGIVVIDEIELHLHSKLQKEVLPELIKLFPKIQFIITSHSPLFLLGMKDALGENGFEVLEMPNVQKIDVECFSEFLRAYNYIKETEQYQKEIEKVANNISTGENPLIITEGSTDWKHMKIAYSVLSSKDENKELFDGLSIDFLEYEPKNSSTNASLKIEMGNDALVPMCETLSKFPRERKLIIIADCDTPQITRKLVANNGKYKEWGNNTYSAVLPIPEARKNTPSICIEHYYSDEEIEKEIEIDGIKRHLFMGKDFNSRGYNYALDRVCERKDLCGENKINIIDGTQGERVLKLSDENDQTNFAISKSGFINYINEHPEEFDFSNFIPLFKLIKSIISEEQNHA